MSSRVVSVPERVVLGGARVDVRTSAQVLSEVGEALASPDAPPLLLASANVDHLTYFGTDSGREHAFDEQQDARWLVLLDGTPLVWAASRLAGTRVELLTGSDLLPALWPVFETRGARIAVLGGRPAMHEALRARLRAEHPGVPVVLALAPTRAELRDRACRDQMAARVRASEADVLLVALGKPTQEEFLLEQGGGPGCGSRPRSGLHATSTRALNSGSPRRCADRASSGSTGWLASHAVSDGATLSRGPWRSPAWRGTQGAGRARPVRSLPILDLLSS